MEQLSKSFSANTAALDAALSVGKNFDIVGRNLLIGEKRAKIYYVDGYMQNNILERILSQWLSISPKELVAMTSMELFSLRYIPFGDTVTDREIASAITAVLLGKTLLLIDGFDYCALIDVKGFPTRGIDEPQDGKVLRGAHDGFIEAVKTNTALIRRRIRDRNFIAEGFKVGDRSKTDVVLCYLQDKVDDEMLAALRSKLSKIDAHSISMGQESIAECLSEKQWYNPFPKVRYTERPDAAAAQIMEGGIILLVDNSPSAMLLPTSFLDFLQETNDFYFPPIIGTYLRFIRAIVFIAALFLTPLWYLLMKNPASIPDFLCFIKIQEPIELPLLLQLLLVEIIVDLLKIASLNTPSSLSNSFSMLGALILGDFAVKAHWLVAEVLVYMAFVAIANFAQPSFELGYAVKLSRIMLLLFIAVGNLTGFFAGVGIILLLLVTTKPIIGRGYLYPLIPFNGRAMLSLVIRKPISRKNT